MLRGGRADAAEFVGRRRGDAGRLACLLFAGRVFDDGFGKLLEHRLRNRVRRHAQPHRVLPAGDSIENMGCAFQDQCHRAGPEFFGQRPRRRRDLDGPLANLLRVGQMHDHRVIGRAAFGSKYFRDGSRVRCIRCEAINGFRRQADQPAGPQQRGSAGAIGRVESRLGWVHGGALTECFTSWRSRQRQSSRPRRAQAASNLRTAAAPASASPCIVPSTVIWPILRPARACDFP